MIEIERYFGFATVKYEEQGGLDDLVGRSDVLSEVVTKIREHKKDRNYINKCWITDMKTLEPVDVVI